jgi:hypothetical protein
MRAFMPPGTKNPPAWCGFYDHAQGLICRIRRISLARRRLVVSRKNQARYRFECPPTREDSQKQRGRYRPVTRGTPYCHAAQRDGDRDKRF